MSETPLLSGLAFTGYRSFSSPRLAEITPRGAVHLLAGPNNSGKSNVLNVAQRALVALRKGDAFPIADADRPLDTGEDAEREFKLALHCEISGEDFEDQPDPKLLVQLEGMMNEYPGHSSSLSGLWIQFTQDKENRLQSSDEQLQHLISTVRDRDALEIVGPLAQSMTGSREGRIPGNSTKVFEAIAAAAAAKLPEVASIGAFRKIDAASSENANGYDGPGLIERLAEVQNPGFVDREKRRRFDRIIEFVRALFEDPDASLEVPNTRDTLLVRHQGRWLPLENYGTGLHEVVILAAAATVLSKTLVCVEEPEIHLHPTLQRRLLTHLSEATDNQYLIATHSAHMLDSERASISAIRLDGERSVIDAVVEPGEVALISSELGARASDLVQANSVIWVEGPSDRIYVSGWITALAPHLVLGVHFEVMHYGGSLLWHLSASDPAVQEFVSLPRINRNFAVVIDSDRTTPRQRLTGTKLRVKQEIAASDGTVVWVTSGYTVENYVPVDMLNDAVTGVHKGVRCTWQGNKYQNPFQRRRIKGRTSAVDKTAIARAVMDDWGGLDPGDWPHDLRQRTRELVAMIERANTDR